MPGDQPGFQLNVDLKNPADPPLASPPHHTGETYQPARTNAESKTCAKTRLGRVHNC
jgi:hypothetical protein